MTARPDYNHPRVAEIFSQKMLPKLAYWSDQEEDDWSDVVSFLMREIRFHQDAYKVAKALDEKYLIDADMAFVELMDEAIAVLSSAIDQATQEWKTENSIVCPSKIGDIVEYEHPHKGKVKGEVVKIHDTAHITLFCENQGHVRKGSGTYGFIVKYEDIIIPTQT